MAITTSTGLEVNRIQAVRLPGNAMALKQYTGCSVVSPRAEEAGLYACIRDLRVGGSFGPALVLSAAQLNSLSPRPNPRRHLLPACY